MKKYTSEQKKLFETEPFCSILNCINSGKDHAVHKNELIQRTGVPDFYTLSIAKQKLKGMQQHEK